MNPVNVPNEIKYGKLSIVSVATPDYYRGKCRKRFVCICACGTKLVVRWSNLKSGNTQSCGCLRKEIKRVVVHGEASPRTPEYKTWCSMRERCFNTKHPKYTLYGGRGISVCKKWKQGYLNFLSDMGRRPGKGYSLDRINNDRGYMPSNCRWATVLEQNKNRRKNGTA
jgi:hypothetical protein